MRILIVDDSGVMRKVVSRELQKMGAPQEGIVEATDGREAIKAVMDMHFDLIIMDWNMPNILGIDAVKAIRSAGINTPIMMLTTESEKINVIMAIQAGANSYLVKPFSSLGFQQKVVELVEGLSLSTAAELRSTGVDLDQGRIREMD